MPSSGVFSRNAEYQNLATWTPFPSVERVKKKSALPPHTASWQKSQWAKPRRGDILITPHVSVGETDTLTISKPRRCDTHAESRHTRPVGPKRLQTGATPLGQTEATSLVQKEIQQTSARTKSEKNLDETSR